MSKNTIHQPDMKTLRVVHVDTVPLYRVEVSDRYHQSKYWLERKFIRTFTDFMEWYLRRYPQIDAHSRLNLSQHLIYMQPGMRAWRQYMPGGYATYHAHDPDKRHMKNGKKTDLMTRALFRHSTDAEGLRSRGAIMAHIAQEVIVQHPDMSVEWMSLATGSAQPAFDACRRLSLRDQRRLTLTLGDFNPEMIAFEKQIYAKENLSLGAVHHVLVDITNAHDRRQLLREKEPLIIDIMGLFEYLSDEQCVDVLGALYAVLAKSGVIIFTNMSPGHPHLHVHQRGLGWPGVIQRTVREVIALAEEAGIPKAAQSVYRAEDKVYNVYRVEKI